MCALHATREHVGSSLSQLALLKYCLSNNPLTRHNSHLHHPFQFVHAQMVEQHRIAGRQTRAECGREERLTRERVSFRFQRIKDGFSMKRGIGPVNSTRVGAVIKFTSCVGCEE